MMRLRGQSGFTLVEVLASLLIFALVTIGVVPLMLATLRGSSLSRAATVGKNVAVEAMERVRGLPLYVSYASEPSRVDVLDLYFPDQDGVQPDGVTYRVNCPAAGPPACLLDLPDNYALTFDSTFVEQVPGSNPEQYQAVPPPDAYSWADEDADSPPENLLQMTITARWTYAGQPRTYSLTSLISNRPFGQREGEAQAAITYGIQARTAYQPTPTQVGFLTATGGAAVESAIELRRVPRASQAVTAAQLNLEDATGAPLLACGTGSEACTVQGAGASAAAPGPDPAIPTVVGPISIAAATSSYPNIAGIDSTGVSSLEAEAAVAPAASGGFSFFHGSATDDFWVDQPASARSSLLQLDPAQRLLSLRSVATSALRGETSAVSDADSVSSASSVSFPELRLLPTSFIPDRTFGGAVIVIQNFTVSVACEADTSSATDPTGSISYSGTLRYWVDPVDDGVVGGAYSPPVTFTQASDVLAGLAGTRRLVYDNPVEDKDNSFDVYLFPIPDHGHARNLAIPLGGHVADSPGSACPSRAGHCGYLARMSNLVPPPPTVDYPTSDIAADGVGERVTIDASGILQIRTHSIRTPQRVAQPPENAVSPISISVGAVRCVAEDLR